MKPSFSQAALFLLIVITGTFFNTRYASAEEITAVPADLTLDSDTDYTISNTIYVNHDATLTIPAGTHITIAPQARLVVYGKLVVSGASQRHVVFSSGNSHAAMNQLALPIERIKEEVQTSEVEAVEIIAPTTQTPEETSLRVSMGIENSIQNEDRSEGIVFMNGSQPSSIVYADLEHFKRAVLTDTAAELTADHVTFKDCDKGVENSFGSLVLTHASFVDTALPGEISVHAMFEHSDTSFSGTGFKGWRYEGTVADEVHLKSHDGEYDAKYLEVLNGGSLYFNYGTTVFIGEGDTVLVHQGGTLFINGTEASPVTVYGGESCQSKNAAVTLNPQSSINIRYTNFHDLCTGIGAKNADITITYSTFKKIEESAIKAEQQSDVTVTHTDITTSGTGLELDNVIIKNISQNNFHNNTVGVSLKNIIPRAIIKNNAWGSDSGPTIFDNPEGKGDTIVASEVPDVVYRPWLGMSDIPDNPPVPEDPDTPDVPPDTPPEPEQSDHDPIIIVPGITGTALLKNYDDKGEVWPNVTKLVANLADSQLDDLALLQSGKESSVRLIVTGDIIRSVASVDVFSGLIRSLQAAGYVEGTNLFVLPYDWRFSNADNQTLLKNSITTALEKSGKSKVNIIAHSMGGLLVKEYLANNTDVPVGHIFNIAVPHLGAPKTFKTLMYGDDMGFTFSLTSALKVPVLNDGRVKSITQNMPSVYELLPSKRYVDLLGPYVQDLTQSAVMGIEEIKNIMIADGRNEKIFPFAQKLHDAVDGISAATIPTYNFVGCGSTNTVTGFTLTKKQSLTLTGFKLVPEHRITYGMGDGVVPVQSANAVQGAHNYYLPSGSHGTMPSLPALQNAILTILQGNSVVIGNGISDAVSTCGITGDTVEVHSPVSLHIYDTQGRHTGPTDTGEIEYGIPNVQYDVINDEKTAFLPSGDNYTIITKAESVGFYDMYVTHTDKDNTVTHETYYHAIPLISATSTGILSLVPNIQSSSIALDDTNDGVTDRTITPSASLDGSKALDRTPPVTQAKIDNGFVTLIATDDNAGVLNTKYSVDNVSWNIYSKPVAIASHGTIYFVSIDNAGNTEDIKQLNDGVSSIQSGGGAPIASTVSRSDSADGTIHQQEEIAEEKVDDANTKKEDSTEGSTSGIATGSFLTAPAPDEGTVMADNEITKNSLIASTGTIAALGSTTVMIIGAVVIVGIGLFVIFSKKRG